jgi:hypothetical protein
MANGCVPTCAVLCFFANVRRIQDFGQLEGNEKRGGEWLALHVDETHNINTRSGPYRVDKSKQNKVKQAKRSRGRFEPPIGFHAAFSIRALLHPRTGGETHHINHLFSFAWPGRMMSRLS